MLGNLKQTLVSVKARYITTSGNLFACCKVTSRLICLPHQMLPGQPHGHKEEAEDRCHTFIGNYTNGLKYGLGVDQKLNIEQTLDMEINTSRCERRD